ncbi:hypothetical protein AwDysgo_13720 [Bacteroidales bacterium]|nr:hypothetical protein AwDysgo_13720 [Bacteroidales bacterium]
MNKNIILYIIGLLVLTFPACEKVIDANLNESDPKIVIQGEIAQDSLCWVKVSKSKKFGDDNQFPGIENAVVSIKNTSGQEEILSFNDLGIYVSKVIRGQLGEKYELTVLVEDQTFTASSTLPEKVKIDSINIYNLITPGGDTLRIPRIFYIDPLGISNYNRKLLFINGMQIKKTIFADDDSFRDGNLIKDLLFYDTEETNDESLKDGDLVRVEMQSIDKGAFDFFNTLKYISQLLTNPTSNIRGGALGYFSAYSQDTISMEVNLELKNEE